MEASIGHRGCLMRRRQLRPTGCRSRRRCIKLESWSLRRRSGWCGRSSENSRRGCTQACTATRQHGRSPRLDASLTLRMTRHYAAEWRLANASLRARSVQLVDVLADLLDGGADVVDVFGRAEEDFVREPDHLFVRRLLGDGAPHARVVDVDEGVLPGEQRRLIDGRVERRGELHAFSVEGACEAIT